MEVDEEEWPLGYDAVDGGSTASVAAIIDGKTLVYAAVGDSAGLLAIPGGGARGNEVGPYPLIYVHRNKETTPQHWRTRKEYTTEVTGLPHRGACCLPYRGEGRAEKR